MKVWAMPVARPYMLNARRAAELMQADLAKVGVEVEIVSYEWAEYLKHVLRQGPRRCRHPRLDRRQRRSGQLPRHPARLRRRRRQQPRPVVQQGVRRSDDEGEGAPPTSQSAPSSTKKPRWSSRRKRPWVHARPLARLRPDEQEGLQASSWIRSASTALTVWTSPSKNDQRDGTPLTSVYAPAVLDEHSGRAGFFNRGIMAPMLRFILGRLGRPDHPRSSGYRSSPSRSSAFFPATRSC